MRQLSALSRALVVVAGFIAGVVVPQSPLPGLVLVLVSAAVLAPLIPWLAGFLARVLSLTPHGRSRALHPVDTLDFSAPAAPGTPGTAQARAPARRVRAFA